MASEALLKQMPQSPCPITEPDHTGRVQDALAYGFEPQPRLEGLEITEDGHQPTLMQPGHDLAGARAMLAQAGQHAHFDLVPGRFALGVAALGSKRDHHPIGPYQEGSHREAGRQGLLGGKVSLGEGLQLLVELLHGPLASRLHPTPHGPWADGATAGPAQQPGRRGKRRKDGQGAPQGLDFVTGPLMRLHPQRLIQRSHLWDDTALGAASDPALPPDRPTQAHHLARGKALTLQGHPTRRARGPGGRPACPLGEDGFDQVNREDAGHLPCCQDERWE